MTLPQTSPPLPPEYPLTSEGDLVDARVAVRKLAGQFGFGVTDTARIVTAASELSRNILLYAGGRDGRMRWAERRRPGWVGLELEFTDRGPGIPNVALSMQEGYSTGKGLGLGLPGCKRLVDEMDLRTRCTPDPEHGTSVTISKWIRTTSA